MLSTVVMVYLVWRLIKLGAKRGRRLTAEDAHSWWWLALLFTLLVGTVAFVGGFLSNPNVQGDVVAAHSLGKMMVFMILSFTLSGLAWFCGWLQRMGGSVEFYIKDHDLTSGPFTLDQLRKYAQTGTLKRDDLICCKGSETWVAASTMMDFDESPSAWLNVLKRRAAAWVQNAKDNLQSTNDMNYRIFIPALILALLLGAVLHWSFAERYRFQAIGGGKMMKTDRWSGEAWMAYGSEWIPVKESR